MKLIRVAVALVLFAAGASAATHAQAAGAPRIAIADHDGHSVVVIDSSTGKTLGNVSLGGDAPDQLLASADRVVAISRGPGKTTWLGDFRPSAVASATIVDTRAMKVLQRVELGWDASDAQITRDGRMLVALSPGVDAKGADGHNAALFAIDLQKGAMLGRSDFDRVAHGMLVAGDQKQAAVYFKGNRRANRPNVLRFVDVGSMKQAGDDVTIAGDVQMPATFSGHEYIYVAEEAKREAAKLYVISAAQRKLTATYDVQTNPKIVAFDDATGRVFLLGTAATRGERGRGGELVVMRNGAPEKRVRVCDEPQRLAYTSDRKSAVIGGAAVSVVSLDTLEVKSQIDQGAGVDEIYVSPDGRRAYFYFPVQDSSSRVSVFDLAGLAKMKSYMVGSNGARVAKGLAAAAATAASYSVARSAAVRHGRSSFYYTVYTPRGAKGGRGMMAVRDDSKYAYAVDPNTGYVSVIDGESGERLQGIRVGGAYELVALKNNAILAVPGSNGITFIDTATNDKSSEATFTGTLRGMETNADRSRLIALYDGQVAVYDERGKLLGDSVVRKPVSWTFLP